MRTAIVLTLVLLVALLALKGSAVIAGVLVSFIVKNFVWGYHLFQ